jgi:hypothetical protein
MEGKGEQEKKLPFQLLEESFKRSYTKAVIHNFYLFATK